MRPLLLDLYCCAGGAAVGYTRAGFDVIGVDIHDQPHYPYMFVRANALRVLDMMLEDDNRLPFAGRRIAAVHASPPCQAHSDLQKQSKIEYEDLIGPTRERLVETGLPYIIENVEGAPLLDTVQLCGANDDVFPELRVIRHRLFESNTALTGVPCPKKHPLVFTYDKRKGHYGKLDQNVSYVQVTGGGNCTIKNAHEAMGIDWMTKEEINEAIPPAYAQYLGEQLLAAVEAAETVTV